MSSITPDLELPTIVVDEPHWQTVHVDGQKPLEYNLPCRIGFRLSTSGYEFVLPEGADFLTPNVIQVVTGKEQLYATAFEKGQTIHTIDAVNLVPMYGSKPFHGFQAGQKIIVAIGHLSPATTELPHPKFVVLWAGVVNIN
jgi:hypothetical protein